LKHALKYTKIDFRAAYNLLQVALGEEWKTEFWTHYGHFEYLVMPFGLTNAPATFESYINSTLREYLDDFCVAYLDDILIYSKSMEEHVTHVRKVLEKLLKHGLYASLEKCQFHVEEVEFLSFVVTPGGVFMEKDKVATIVDWPSPKSVHDIQILLGFANFYRRFIQAYLCVVLSITSLLRKTTAQFNWTPEAQAAFERLKILFTEAPILRHYDSDLPVFLYTDTSGFATLATLCQKQEGQLHPVAFWSRKSNPAKCNYDIHDCEMLAIVLALGHWRHYREGAKHTVTIFTDHKNLEVFMSTEILNRRQARWAELLSGYDFVLVHTPGSTNPADGPLRRPDYDTDIPQPSGSLLPPSVFQSDPPHSAQVFQMSAFLSVFTLDTTLHQRFIDAYNADAIAMAQRVSTTDSYQWRNDLFLHKSQVYVPHSLCLDVLRMHRDDPLASHFGIARTLELLSHNYWFPYMPSFVENYVSTCDTCSRGKPS